MNKDLLLGLTFLVLAAAVVYFAVMPFWQSLKEVKTEVEKKEDRIVTVKKIIQRTEELKTKYEELEPKKEKLDKAIPDDRKTSHLLVQLEKMASNNGLLLNNINFSEDKVSRAVAVSEKSQSESQKASKNLSRLSVSTGLQGSYSSFKNFFKSLESNVRIMDVNSFSLTSGAGSGSFGSYGASLKGNINFKTYYHDQEKAKENQNKS